MNLSNVITNPISNIPKNEKSHVHGWTQLWRDQLKASIEEENIENISQTAHKMLTMCRQIDAKKVIPILETLEDISAEEKSQLPSLFENLNLEINNLITDLQQKH